MAALTQTAANVALGTGGKKKQVTSGGTVTAGMPVYLDAADGLYKPSRANAAGTAACAGIALNGASSGQPLCIQESGGEINLGATLTPGTTYCVSDAVAGQIVPYVDLGAADLVVVLGIARTAALMTFNVHDPDVAKP